MMNGNTVGYTFPWYPITLTEGTHTLRIKISGGGLYNIKIHNNTTNTQHNKHTQTQNKQTKPKSKSKDTKLK